jgi:hypothetical protein
MGVLSDRNQVQYHALSMEFGEIVTNIINETPEFVNNFSKILV